MVTTKELVPVCHVVTHTVHTPDVHNDTYHNTTRDNTNPHVPQQHTIRQAHTVYTMSRTTMPYLPCPVLNCGGWTNTRRGKCAL